jgi:hypothetical protein
MKGAPTRRILIVFMAIIALALSGCSATTDSSPPDSSAPPTTVALPPGTLTGYGATRAAWDQTHQVDNSPGHRDGAYPRLPNNEDTYMLVTFSADHVSSYILNFDPPVPASQAIGIALLNELPDDVVNTADQTHSTCRQLYYTSQTLATAGDDAIGVFVELLSGTSDSSPYDAHSVTSAIFGVASASSPIPC